MPLTLRRNGPSAIAAATCAAVAIALAARQPSAPVLAALLGGVGALGIVVFFATARYSWTLAALGVYLALFDGSLRLLTGASALTLVRDVMVVAISGGALARILLRRERVTLPPLTGFILAFVGLVLVEIFNPNEPDFLHGVASVRQHVEFVPLFFFGYFSMRSRARLQAFLFLLVAVAAINGIVSLIQVQLTPEQLGSWGPGYHDRYFGKGLISPRVYYGADNAEYVRPVALGSDLGFGGNLGLIAAPAALALLVLVRRTWQRVLILALGSGTALAVITSQNREAVVGTVVCLLAYICLVAANRRVLSTIIAATLGVVLVSAVVSVIGSVIGSHAFQRYRDITPAHVLHTSYGYRKDEFVTFGHYLGRFPLGAGLGSGGPAVGFFGKPDPRSLNSETEFNFLLIELGIPGLLLFIFLVGRFLALTPRIRGIGRDGPRLELAVIGAALIGDTVTWIAGPATTSSPGGPLLWFGGGILVWWLRAGKRRGPLVGGATIAERSHPGTAVPAPVRAATPRGEVPLRPEATIVVLAEQASEEDLSLTLSSLPGPSGGVEIVVVVGDRAGATGRGTASRVRSLHAAVSAAKSPVFAILSAGCVPRESDWAARHVAALGSAPPDVMATVGGFVTRSESGFARRDRHADDAAGNVAFRTARVRLLGGLPEPATLAAVRERAERAGLALLPIDDADLVESGERHEPGGETPASRTVEAREHDLPHRPPSDDSALGGLVERGRRAVRRRLGRWGGTDR